MAKVAIIGAGSLSFSRKLTIDILSHESLQDTTFALVDIDETRLNYAEKIASQLIIKGEFRNATVQATTDRREALKDADYVIISILVGGYDAIEKEIDIPRAYGINQCVGDTLTPGGIMRCVRTLPVLLDICSDICELCPRALVLNYTNPLSMLSWGICERFPDLNYVGLCHSVQATTREWADRLGHAYKEVCYDCAGINHQAWITRFENSTGTDLLPRIRECVYNPSIWKGDSTRMEYLKHFGYPVTESSGHCSEYNPWFRKNETTISRYCDHSYDKWNGEEGYIKKLYNRPDWERTMRDLTREETEVHFTRSIEYGSHIIRAHETNEPTIIYGNVKNHGIIENLPHDAIVEVACVVDKNGIQPMHYGFLPAHCAALNTTQINVQRLAVAATLNGDPERLFQAMALDPLTSMSCTLDEIRSMTRELMKAHKPYIPCMKGKLPEKKKVMYTATADSVERHIDPSEE